MLTRNAINGVYAAQGGHVDRHQFGGRELPRTPALKSQAQLEEEVSSEKPADLEDHQPPG